MTSTCSGVHVWAMAADAVEQQRKPWSRCSPDLGAGRGIERSHSPQVRESQAPADDCRQKLCWASFARSRDGEGGRRDQDRCKAIYNVGILVAVVYVCISLERLNKSIDNQKRCFARLPWLAPDWFPTTFSYSRKPYQLDMDVCTVAVDGRSST